MKKIISKLCVLLFLLAGCQENWSDYYTQTEGGDTDASATANLLDQLKSVPEYSKFVELLEETKVSEELSRNQVLTVWAPTNASMPAEVATMSEKDKITLCKNHINYVALYNTKLTDGKVIKTLAGKNLIIKENGADQFSFDGQEVTKLNQNCTNGVIHEINGWLMPRKNIFEYILEDAGPEYSIIRDSLLARCDTVFKPGLSFPLGVDELGNTLYDSVFVIENSLLEYKSDIRSEDEDFTMFLPTDQCIKNMYQEMNDYFANSGSFMTQRDSTKFFGWILRSIIHQGKIDTYAGNFTSPYGYEWRSEKQLIAPGGYKSFSNGYVYEVEKIHIPKFMYLTSMKSYTYYLSELPEDKLDEYLTMTNVNSYDLAKVYAVGHPFAQVLGNKTEPTASYEFTTLAKDFDGKLIDGKLSPGFYSINVSYRIYLCGNIRLSINGEEVITFNSNSGTEYVGREIVKSFEVKEEWGFNTLKIKQEDVGKAGRIMMEYIEFIPTEDNY